MAILFYRNEDQLTMVFVVNCRGFVVTIIIIVGVVIIVQEIPIWQTAAVPPISSLEYNGGGIN